MIDFVAVLAEPLQHAFMVRAILAAMMVGALCAVVGSFVILRGMAFLGDALAHAILPGVAAGYLIHQGARGPVFWWSLGTAILAALAVGAVSRRTELKEDAAIGIIFSGMFALGIAMISTMRTYAVDLAHFLFGHVLGVTASDLWATACLGGLVLVLIACFYKEFLVLSFDPILARTLRLPVRALNYLLLILVAVCVVVSLQTVGVGLMMAMLVTPASAAYLLTRRLIPMIGIAAALGAFSGLAGLYLSYYLNMASGASIVIVCTVLFLLALIFSPRRGLLRRARPKA